jgi:hypothetical protein
MERRHGWVGVALVLSFTLCGCTAQGEPAKPSEPATADAGPKTTPAPEPETPADFLALAEKAMAKEPGWTFAVTGKEGVTMQGQENTASFEATVEQSRRPEALHSKGRSISKGSTESEEIYLVGDAAYLKEGDAGWKKKPGADPEIQNKVENPLAALARFDAYLKASKDDVTVTKGAGKVTLQVGFGEKKLTDVQDRDFVKRAMREFEPTAKQLREAGVGVEDSQLSFSHLKETLVLDSATYRIESHRFKFQIHVPNNGRDIFYGQDVREENKGPFDGEIKPPADVA